MLAPEQPSGDESAGGDIHLMKVAYAANQLAISASAHIIPYAEVNLCLSHTCSHTPTHTIYCCPECLFRLPALQHHMGLWSGLYYTLFLYA